MKSNRTHHGQGQEDWFKGLALRAQLVDVDRGCGAAAAGCCVLMMYSFDEHEDDVLDALDEVADEPKLTSAAEAFRKAKARPVVDDDAGSDDELEVEELPLER